MSWLAAGIGKLSALKEKVQKNIPIDREMLAKLTLNTDQMIAERQQFGQEAKRRAEVKDMLAGMFPWETRDAERDILVEECKEAILALSASEETFFGPYEMPLLKVKIEDEEVKPNQEGEETDEKDEKEETDDKKVIKDRKPSPESLEKLAKLEPLPPLLSDFDLDIHVGLIQKLLKLDPKLVKMQGTLSGKFIEPQRVSMES